MGGYIRSVAPTKYHGLFVPSTQISCKRRVMDSRYLRALHRDSIELVYDDPVEEIVGHGDFIQLTQSSPTPSGTSSSRAPPRRTSAPASPSSRFYSIMMGPNTATAHGSVPYIIECQIDLTLRLIQPLLNGLRAQRPRSRSRFLPVLGPQADTI
ncbi:hypothetical protein E4U21_002562 [Claviceps maximensis]|nr:hypothetical protein E4U21_002562 [Claviceps maximensis]